MFFKIMDAFKSALLWSLQILFSRALQAVTWFGVAALSWWYGFIDFVLVALVQSLPDIPGVSTEAGELLGFFHTANYYWPVYEHVSAIIALYGLRITVYATSWITKK